MGNKKGNQDWRLRLDLSQDGRKYSIKEVERRVNEYFDHAVNERWFKVDFRGKDNTKVDIPTALPMTLEGLCNHLNIVLDTWYEWAKDKKYSDIITRANQLLKEYNLKGAGGGFFNPSIIARYHGLSDKQEVTVKEQPLFNDELDDEKESE